MDTPLIISNYELHETIGVGAYGEVRYGIDLSNNNHVAIKIVDLGRFRNETTITMKQEISILKNTNHQNIISIIDVKENIKFRGTWCVSCACSNYENVPNSNDSNCLYCNHSANCHSTPEVRLVTLVITELAVGGELFGLLIHSGYFSEELARFYFIQLIQGLEYCHDSGIIHRDLKPENLVLDAHFQLKIVDFGLAALYTEDIAFKKEGEENLTTPTFKSKKVLHSGIGSQPYTAPEVYYNNEIYDGKGYDGEPADLWSCAVILFIMMTAPPFRRPLLRSYGSTLKKCKYFVDIMNGIYPTIISSSAKDLLSNLFVLDPLKRFTIKEIKAHPWFNGPTPNILDIGTLMEDRASKSWINQGKKEMHKVLKQVRTPLSCTPTKHIDINQITPISLNNSLNVSITTPNEAISKSIDIPIILSKSTPSDSSFISTTFIGAKSKIIVSPSVLTPGSPSLLTLALKKQSTGDSSGGSNMSKSDSFNSSFSDQLTVNSMNASLKASVPADIKESTDITFRPFNPKPEVFFKSPNLNNSDVKSDNKSPYGEFVSSVVKNNLSRIVNTTPNLSSVPISLPKNHPSISNPITISNSSFTHSPVTSLTSPFTPPLLSYWHKNSTSYTSPKSFSPSDSASYNPKFLKHDVLKGADNLIDEFNSALDDDLTSYGRNARTNNIEIVDDITRDDFGVRQYTRVDILNTKPSAVFFELVNIFTNFKNLNIKQDTENLKFYIMIGGGDPSTFGIVDNCKPIMSCTISILNHNDIHTIVDFKKTKGDVVAFHNFFMQINRKLTV